MAAPLTASLRRDLGTIESYATLLGMLIGAGIFKVTSDAWQLTGSSVILGYLVLAPAILATSVAYSVFLSTPLGREPGGEYTHLSRTFGGYGVAFIGVWLKVISYIGALAYLSRALGDYVVELFGGMLAKSAAMPIAIGSLLFFYVIHVAGVRWFGRIQVWMCVLLGVSIIVLVVPGVFAVHLANYKPFFTHGAGGFAAALPLIFFAYAGFESLAQTAGEVRDSTHKLPRIFLRGILATTVIYFLMSAVAFGVLPGAELRRAAAPMAEVASRYLPMGAAWFVTFGAVMALTTSVNATMLVPSRVGIMLAEDGLAPQFIGSISKKSGTPVVGLTLTLIVTLILLVSGQISLALNIAVFALVVLYFLHSVALLALPRANPSLYASVTLGMPLIVQRIAAVISLLFMGTLIAVQLMSDVGVLRRLSFRERIEHASLTTIELVLFWVAIGAVLYVLAARKRRAVVA
ncbi:MAG: basic amino acid/polyamine antiporter, family [Thermoanaerobaculia bacterium]|jgi:amino acid transporter|nr:basic amino acid/polyamine antiporter, family [Thermoanaerobaculia bacterium]